MQMDNPWLTEAEKAANLDEALHVAKDIGWTQAVCANSTRDIVAQEAALWHLAGIYGKDAIQDGYAIGSAEGEAYEQ